MNQKDAADNVEAMDSISSAEKETGIHFTGDDTEFTITTYRPTIVKSLLKHEHMDVYHVIIKGADGTHKSMKMDEDDWDSLQEETIVGCHARGPIGLLTVKSVPRSKDHQSQIVNHKQMDADAFDS